jgi:hypothetical protein
MQVEAVLSQLHAERETAAAESDALRRRELELVRS